MYFELSITIRRPLSEVFTFLRDKDKHPRGVLLLEQVTPGVPGVGTHYREVVQMMPFIRGGILFVITRFEPDEYLEENFEGAGFKGHLAYQFLPEDDGTRLTQGETMFARGLLKVFEPLIERMFFRHLQERLEAIKAILESA